jgi:N-acyl amino acid synthase FeeM
MAMNAEVKPQFFWRDTRFSERTAELLRRVDYRRADTSEQREAIFRLRYDAYRRDDAIAPDPLGRVSDCYDDGANVHHLALYVDGELASALRLHVGSAQNPDFSALEVFPAYQQTELQSGTIYIGTSYVVADEKSARHYRQLPYLTLRLSVLAAEHFGAAECLIAASSEQRVFYERAFKYQTIGEARPCPPLLRPLSLMALHFPVAAAELYRRYPFFRSSAFERRRLFEREQTLKSAEPLALGR